jgi:uncharacterized circularly permuted ATP-grasp superfamily protein/uncharacterized alpha-E superfamily protein
MRSDIGFGRHYDELVDTNGEVRAHWRPLLDVLTARGADAVRHGVEVARRLIVENGVTYNVYADPKGKDRPWVLDPLPFLLREDEWREIAAGIAQRAELCDRLLADLYGPQQLLAEGVVPPEIPFGHPNFLWPCVGIAPPQERWLHLYAADLARGPDGRWWVLGDRTQTPSGAGYALENRQIVTRVFPDMIQDLDVRAIDDFFAAVREQLLGAAAPGEPPLAVVLTPGPWNETYFEHAYLARQLGFPLVEGQDLTVRGDTVHLKTLGGLRRVHAILRRLDDDFCDPLELRGDSALGVPGLIHAVRAGNVTVANALGSGVLESAGWTGFLPGVAERLLGAKLRLPSVATWWCGEKPALEYVVDNLHRLVVKPTYPNQRFEPVFGRDLDGPERARLRARLRAHPHAYVAQERISLSQAPVWRADGKLSFRARSLGIRVYAIATPSGYRVMPGGLARVAVGDLADVLSTQRGGGSKDIWVLGGEAGTEEPTAIFPTPVRPSGRDDDLPSRLVENLYWLGRYTERCDDKTRLLRATFAMRSRPDVWTRAVETCRLFGATIPGSGSAGALLDDPATGGLAFDLGRLVACASEARSRLSSESWRIASRLARQLRAGPSALLDPREALDRLLVSLIALSGLVFDDMRQDDGWRLTMLGRRLERLQFLALLLSQRLSSGIALLQGELGWLLDIADSTIHYRTRFLSTPQLESVLELLVLDETNPRAVAFQWQSIRRLSGDLAAPLGATLDDKLENAIGDLYQADFGSVCGAGGDGPEARRKVAAHLDCVALAAGQLSDRLSARHFSHTEDEIHTVST